VAGFLALLVEVLKLHPGSAVLGSVPSNVSGFEHVSSQDPTSRRPWQAEGKAHHDAADDVIPSRLGRLRSAWLGISAQLASDGIVVIGFRAKSLVSCAIPPANSLVSSSSLVNTTAPDCSGLQCLSTDLRSYLYSHSICEYSRRATTPAIPFADDQPAQSDGRIWRHDQRRRRSERRR